MVTKGYIYVMSVSAIAITGCKKPYAPPAITANNNYLVVEGVINSGLDSTVIRLSRTVNLSGKTIANPEKGALVIVQSDQGANYQLKETKPGRYVSSPLNLNSSRNFGTTIEPTFWK